MRTNHFIATAGLHGCMPNFCCAVDSYKDAVETLADLHELGRTRKASLKRNGSLELNMRRDGNEYCEITKCDCGAPDSHDD